MELFRDTVDNEELKDAIVLIFLNKSDLLSSVTMKELKKKFMEIHNHILHSHKYGDRVYHILPCSASSGDGLVEGFDWLVTALRTAPGIRPTAVVTAVQQEQQEKDRMESLLEEWLTREDEPDDAFLSKLRDCTLDVWDHRTHLRIAWILLRKHGRREGMKLIFEDIQHFIENSPRTQRGGGGNNSNSSSNGTPSSNRGTTFHETMTYFWVHMVHYGMESVNALPNEEFKTFLVMNPHLANGGLFLHYYSKHRMLHDPDARTMVLLPDKAPLPSLLVDVDQLLVRSAAAAATGTSSSSSSSTAAGSDHTARGNSVGVARLVPRDPLSDTEFLRLLSTQRLPGWGHEAKLRAIYLLLCRWGRSSRSVDALLEVLRVVEKEAGFHLSINYFWIQMVTYHIVAEIKASTAATVSAVGGLLSIFSSAASIRSSTDSGAPAVLFSAFNDPFYVLPSDPSLLMFDTEQVATPASSAATSDSNVATTSTATAATANITTSTVAVPVGSSSISISSNNKSNKDISTNSSSGNSNMPFTAFILRPHCQRLRNPLLYEKYFSRGVVDGSSARELALPDLKQLPSVV